MIAPESTLPVLEARLLEVVKHPLPEDTSGRLLPRSADAVLAAAEKADAVAIGPGLGRSDLPQSLLVLPRKDNALGDSRVRIQYVKVRGDVRAGHRSRSE